MRKKHRTRCARFRSHPCRSHTFLCTKRPDYSLSRIEPAINRKANYKLKKGVLTLILITAILLSLFLLCYGVAAWRLHGLKE